MKIKIKRYSGYDGPIVSIETSSGVEIVHLNRDRLPGKIRKQQYYLNRGYYRNNKVKVIGVDLIE
jgi:hypothetical protein